MRASCYVALVSAYVGVSVHAQVILSPLDHAGNLTWSNSVPDATYRVEWASSPEGAWQDFRALTNLLVVQAHTNRVSLKVPMLYRVVWTDPPAPDPVGTWAYQLAPEHSSAGPLSTTGLFALRWTNEPVIGPHLAGTWEAAGDSRSLWGFTNGFEVRLQTGDYFDDNHHFVGNMYGDVYSGRWEWNGLGFLAYGAFTARKVARVAPASAAHLIDRTEPVAPHEPPLRVSVSDTPDDRALGSLPAPGSSGGR